MPTTVVTLVYDNFPRILANLRPAAQAIALKTALDIESTVKVGMAEGKSGIMHGNHQASAPGEMPAIDTGVLVNSITTEQDGDGAVVYTNVEYALKLEFGFPVEGFAPRPFFGPAADQHRAAYVQAMADLERSL